MTPGTCGFAAASGKDPTKLEDQMSDDRAPSKTEGTPTLARGRAARLAQRRSPQPRRPYISRRMGTFNILDEEGLSLIEANADQLLKEVGMEFRDDPEILAFFELPGQMCARRACASSPACAAGSSKLPHRLSSCSMPETPPTR